MPNRFLDAVLWLLSGAIWWLCAHSMTVIFPTPGPWLPTEVAVPTGGAMGLIAHILSSKPTASYRTTKRLMYLVGFLAGSYLGWMFARGSMTATGWFFPAAAADRQLSALVCGLLGLGANSGMLWVIINMRDKPITLFSVLLLLIALLFSAVFLIVSFSSDGLH